MAGIAIEVGCAWILIWSPSLTAIYTPEFTRDFFQRLPWLRAAFPSVALDVPGMLTVLETGLCAMIAGYVLALRALTLAGRRDGGPILVGFALLFRATLLLLPGLFSTDIFSYVIAGRIAAVHDTNPYVATPADFAGDPFLSWVFPFWRDAPTVYGPVWTDLSWLMGKLTGEWANVDQVAVYRLTLFALELLALGLLWRLLQSTVPRGDDRRPYWLAFCVYAWNPLVLFDLVGNAHNDIAMVTLMLLGILLAVHARPRASVVALSLGALIKFTSGVVVLMWLTAWSASARTLVQAATRVAFGVVVIVSLTALLAWPWLDRGALASLGESSAGRVAINSVPELAAVSTARQVLVPGGLAPDAAEVLARMWSRMLARGAFALYLLWEVARLWRSVRADAFVSTDAASLAPIRAVLHAATRALLVLPLVLLSSVWSWYFTWSLTLAVLLGWSSWLTRLVVLYTLVNLPLVYAQQYLNEAAPGILPLVSAVGPLMVWATWYRLSRRFRRTSAQRDAPKRLPV